MTKKSVAVSTAKIHLQRAIQLLADPKTRQKAAHITEAQDAILLTLGAIEKAAYTYVPTAATDPDTGARLYSRKVEDQEMANAYETLQQLSAPLIDQERPDAAVVKTALPLLEAFTKGLPS